MAHAPRISPPVAINVPAAAKAAATADLAEATLPPDVLKSWNAVAVALGRSLPDSINRTAIHRAAIRATVR